MFKTFYLNKDYSFDFEGNCKFRDKLVESDSEFVEISISGIVKSFIRKWLGLICHYEVEHKLEDMMKIDFVECNSRVLKLRCKHLMIIKQPIEIDNRFRVIPGFTKFAIDKNGNVISLKSKKILKEAIGPYGYPYVNIYDPDKNKWRSVSTHLLLTRVYIFNDEPAFKVYVNHKDGNKLNYKLNNLEWTTPGNNSNHAFAFGLRTDNIRCKVRATTGEIENYPSVGAALTSKGLKRSSNLLMKKVNGNEIPSLILGRYEIKSLEDTSDWFYTTPERINGIYINRGPFQAFNVLTKNVVEAKTITDLSKITGITVNVIQEVLKRFRPLLRGEYLFRIKSDLPWPLVYDIKDHIAPRKMKITNSLNGEVKYFNSLSGMRKFLHIDKRTLKKRLQTGQNFKDWKIEEINIHS